jgi:hypothetical protein
MYNFKIERDDAGAEIDVLRDKLDKATMAAQKALEERDLANKEFERMLEKYDRFANFLTKRLVLMLKKSLLQVTRRSVQAAE